MTLINKDNLNTTINIAAVLKGVLLTIVFSLFLSVLTGVAYHFSSLTDQSLPWFSVAILAVSAFSGSLYAGRQAGNKGLYHGLAVGLLFFSTVWLSAGLLMPGQAILGIACKLLITSSAGALGGIIGVGLS
jgi:putative membrane protein (TIGR04086 family)